jgi:hypothetical protein
LLVVFTAARSCPWPSLSLAQFRYLECQGVAPFTCIEVFAAVLVPVTSIGGRPFVVRMSSLPFDCFSSFRLFTRLVWLPLKEIRPAASAPIVFPRAISCGGMCYVSRCTELDSFLGCLCPAPTFLLLAPHHFFCAILCHLRSGCLG